MHGKCFCTPPPGVTPCRRIYSEEQPGEAATALFIKRVTEADGGDYRCSATSASNQHLEATVSITVFSELPKRCGG